MLILPIEKWHAENRLVGPTGEPYDPNSAPAIIDNNYILRSGLEYGRENAHRIGVTVLCGLQAEAADLGDPGEFEQLLSLADMYGSALFGAAAQDKNQGYTNRVESAFMRLGSVGGDILPFNTVVWRDMEGSETLRSLREMETAIQIAGFDFDDMVELDTAGIDTEAALKAKERDFVVGNMHLANHTGWAVIANACDQARQYYDGKDRIQIVVDEDIFDTDAVRKWGALGIAVDLRHYRMEEWPDGAIEQALDIGRVLATGELPPIQ